jgi:hypothetical protein
MAFSRTETPTSRLGFTKAIESVVFRSEIIAFGCIMRIYPRNFVAVVSAFLNPSR